MEELRSRAQRSLLFPPGFPFSPRTRYPPSPRLSHPVQPLLPRGHPAPAGPGTSALQSPARTASTLPRLPLPPLLACLPFSLLRLRSFASISVRLRCRFFPPVRVLPAQDRGLPRKYLTRLYSVRGPAGAILAHLRIGPVCFYSGLNSCQP